MRVRRFLSKGRRRRLEFVELFEWHFYVLQPGRGEEREHHSFIAKRCSLPLLYLVYLSVFTFLLSPSRREKHTQGATHLYIVGALIQTKKMSSENGIKLGAYLGAGRERERENRRKMFLNL